MRERIQLSCVECKRKKIKCNRNEPCSNCLKYNTYCFYIKKNKNSIELGQQNTSENQLSQYHLKNSNRLESKWSKLTFTLERLIDWSCVDPQINSIMTNFNLTKYEQIAGKKLKNGLLRTTKRVRLDNDKVPEPIEKLLEILIGMSFKFCLACPVSEETVKEVYSEYGINSFLINSIAACMLPKYLLLTGNTRYLDLKDNPFYLKALFLLESPLTSAREIMLGTLYLMLLEISHGNLWVCFIHLGKFNSICLESKVNLIDSDHPFNPRDFFHPEKIEVRNAWWCRLSGEVAISAAYFKPLHLRANPQESHIPHPQLDFTPGPYGAMDDLDEKLHKYDQCTPYNKVPHFYGLAKLTWLCQALCPYIDIFLRFFKPEHSEFDQRKMIDKFQSYYPNTFGRNMEYYCMKTYEEDVIENPDHYANTTMLMAILLFNTFHIFYYLLLAKYLHHLNDYTEAKLHKVEAKLLCQELIGFISRTMILPGYPDPKVDLTQFYVSCPLIPLILTQLIKVFLPAESTEDIQILQFFVELMKQFAIFSPYAEIYLQWCQSQIKTNGKFFFNPNSGITPPTRIMVKVLQEKW